MHSSSIQISLNFRDIVASKLILFLFKRFELNFLFQTKEMKLWMKI